MLWSVMIANDLKLHGTQNNKNVKIEKYPQQIGRDFSAWNFLFNYRKRKEFGRLLPLYVA